MDDKVRKQIAEFSMPQATTGTLVMWYRSARRSGSDAIVAYILHCGARTAQLFLASGRRVDAVRHIDDPKLGLNQDQREQGAWDFTPESKKFAADKMELEKRVASLEKAVEALSKSKGGIKKKPGPPPGTDNLADYRRLKQRAENLGLNPNQKKAELQDQIDQKEKEQADPQRFAVSQPNNSV